MPNADRLAALKAGREYFGQGRGSAEVWGFNATARDSLLALFDETIERIEREQGLGLNSDKSEADEGEEIGTAAPSPASVSACPTCGKIDRLPVSALDDCADPWHKTPTRRTRWERGEADPLPVTSNTLPEAIEQVMRVLEHEYSPMTRQLRAAIADELAQRDRSIVGLRAMLANRQAQLDAANAQLASSGAAKSAEVRR